jgi:hypothetical protein
LWGGNSSLRNSCSAHCWDRSATGSLWLLPSSRRRRWQPIQPITHHAKSTSHGKHDIRRVSVKGSVICVRGISRGLAYREVEGTEGIPRIRCLGIAQSVEWMRESVHGQRRRPAPPGPGAYLQGATLTLRPWSSDRPDWDHDHCDFCCIHLVTTSSMTIQTRRWKAGRPPTVITGSAGVALRISVSGSAGGQDLNRLSDSGPGAGVVGFPAAPDLLAGAHVAGALRRQGLAG